MSGKKRKNSVALQKKAKLKQELKRKKKFTTAIFIICGVILAGILVTVSVLAVSILNPINKVEGKYKPYSAVVTATGESVELSEIYNYHASNYTGRLYLNSDKTFEYWVQLGDDDGTHTGTYNVDLQSSKIIANFDSGDTDTFDFTTDKTGKLEAIIATYGDYSITFNPEDSQVFQSSNDQIS